MRVVHEGDEVIGGDDGPTRTVLATEVEVADSVLSQAKGLMFRSSLPEEFALVLDVGGGGLLPFSDGPQRQFVHMLFMRVPIDVIWLVENRVVETATLSPWTGFGFQKADRILELPAGGAEGVGVGDTVRVEGPDAE